MKIDFFYKGRTYGSTEANEAPRVGAFYGDKMIIKIADFRFSKIVKSEGNSQVEQADFHCELGDP